MKRLFGSVGRASTTLSLTVVMLLASTMLSLTCVAQNDTLTLARAEMKEILMTIKQDGVMDTVEVKAKRDAIVNIQAALKNKAESGTIIVPREYVLKYIDRMAWEFDMTSRYLEQRSKLLRVVDQYYMKDPKLAVLKDKNLNGAGEFYRLNELKGKLSKELKYEATLPKKTFDIAEIQAKEVAIQKATEAERIKAEIEAKKQ